MRSIVRARPIEPPGGSGDASLDAAFNEQLKAALARRRRKTMSPSDDNPSAAGEDG